MPPGVGVLASLALLRAGQQENCWTLFDTNKVRPLPEAWLQAIEDGQPIVVGSAEAEVYPQILATAYYTSRGAFERKARKDLTYAHLFNSPAKYRGQVVHIEGRLRRVTRFDPPAEATQEGVSDLYEAWIFNGNYGPHPYCVVFTDWPDALPRSLLGKQKVEEHITVEFAGYFYKKYRYKAADSKTTTAREAPLLMGHSLRVVTLGAPADDPGATQWTFGLLYLVVGLFIATVGLVAGLTFYFRRADEKLRQRLLANRAGELVLPPPDALPVSMPPPGARHLPAAQDRSARPPTYPRTIFPTGDSGSSGDGGKFGKDKDGGPDEGAGV